MHPDESSETYKGKKQELLKDERSSGFHIELNKKDI